MIFEIFISSCFFDFGLVFFFNFRHYIELTYSASYDIILYLLLWEMGNKTVIHSQMSFFCRMKYLGISIVILHLSLWQLLSKCGSVSFSGRFNFDNDTHHKDSIIAFHSNIVYVIASFKKLHTIKPFINARY